MIIVIMLMMLMMLAFASIVFLTIFFGRDERDFNHKGIHKNGTSFDDLGYDVYGYDRDGYNKAGYNRQGYDKSGFDAYGYKIDGRNANGKYNRLYDRQSYAQSRYNREGFLNPRVYHIAVTNHARERIYERYHNGEKVNADNLAHEAYAYGKSSCQLMKTSAVELRDIENRYENGIALIYKGYVFIFSEENVLITMYKNERVIVWL